MSRETALRVLIACRTNGAWADAALQAQIKRAALSRRDAALCSRLVYGVLQNQLLLDFYIGTYCSQRPDHLQPPLQDILRLGAYQILYLEKVPDSAAVNSSVELAKHMKRGQAAGLVNAVLRKLSQNKDRLPAIPDQDEAKYLSIRYSHPKWLVKRLLPILGRTETEVFLACGNTQPPITAQINTCRTTAERTAEALAVEGVRAEAHPWMPACLLLSGTGDLEHVEAFQSGSFYIQDPAARLSVMASGIKPGERMLDVCAAPGGKSFAAAIQMGDRGTVLACDIHQNKLKRIHDGAARLGLQSIETTAVDGRIFRAEWEGRFDLVLVDAPCSGLGIIRKKPDISIKKLYLSGREVGYDIMGTMISVLLFTFAAGLIPSFLIRMNNEVAFFTNVRLYIPFEISRFLIESIGIVAAIPISIVVASALFKLQIRKGREK